MRQRYAAYAPLRRGRRAKPRHLFRAARPSAVGWTVLTLLCAAAGWLGALLARLSGAPPRLGAVAAPGVALGGLLLADRRRWGASSTNYSWGASQAEVDAIVDELATQGVPASRTADGKETACLTYRSRDTKTVDRVLRRHGIPALRPL